MLLRILKKIFKREQSRENTLQVMRQSEMQDYQEMLRDIRLSNLTEKEKEEQRNAVRKQHFHNLDIIK